MSGGNHAISDFFCRHTQHDGPDPEYSIQGNAPQTPENALRLASVCPLARAWKPLGTNDGKQCQTPPPPPFPVQPQRLGQELPQKCKVGIFGVMFVNFRQFFTSWGPPMGKSHSQSKLWDSMPPIWPKLAPLNMRKFAARFVFFLRLKLTPFSAIAVPYARLKEDAMLPSFGEFVCF